MKRRMEKENFALTDEEIMKKNFPIVYVDGSNYFIDVTDRGKEVIVSKTAWSKSFYYPTTVLTLRKNLTPYLM